MNVEKRIREVQEKLDEESRDWFVAVGPSDVFYLSGFYKEGDNYPVVLVPQEGDPVLLVSRMDVEAADEQSDIDAEEIRESVTEEITERTNGTVLTGKNMSIGLYSGMEGINVEASDILSTVKSVKDEAEVERIEAAYSNVENAVRSYNFEEGETERQVAAGLEYSMRVNGSDGTSFPTIVASGVNSSRPHHTTSSQETGRNALLVDIGSRMDGYVSDLSRTFHVGNPSNRFEEVYRLVRESQKRAENELEAGREAGEVDRAARNFLENEGYGEDFIHSTGHGVGVDIHEIPNLYVESDRELEEGMVVTLEPGVYLENEFGVRIEDAYLVTGKGPERLTTLPRDLDSNIIHV